MPDVPQVAGLVHQRKDILKCCLMPATTSAGMKTMSASSRWDAIVVTVLNRSLQLCQCQRCGSLASSPSTEHAHNLPVACACACACGVAACAQQNGALRSFSISATNAESASVSEALSPAPSVRVALVAVHSVRRHVAHALQRAKNETGACANLSNVAHYDWVHAWATWPRGQSHAQCMPLAYDDWAQCMHVLLGQRGHVCSACP